MEFLSQSAALSIIDPDNPPSAATANTWHDRICGPRDTYGRRIWTPEVCAAICAARATARPVRARAARVD